MYAWARKLKKKTDAGAVLCIDGELWENPKWKIGSRSISITCGNITLGLLEPGEDPKEAEAEMRERMRVLVPA